MGEDDQIQVQPNLSPYKFPSLASAADHLSGMATPPLHALASVPFKWEEQPGKPRPCTDIIVRPETPRCLELPPCRTAGKLTRMLSPTTVLDGPNKFSSFRIFREKQSSFDSCSSGGSPHSQKYVDVSVGKKSNERLKTTRWLRRSFRGRSGKKETDEGSLGFSPSSFAGFESVPVAVEGKMRRKRISFSSSSQTAPSPLWASVYESLKRAIPWKRTRKSKN